MGGYKLKRTPRPPRPPAPGGAPRDAGPLPMAPAVQRPAAGGVEQRPPRGASGMGGELLKRTPAEQRKAYAGPPAAAAQAAQRPQSAAVVQQSPVPWPQGRPPLVSRGMLTRQSTDVEVSARVARMDTQDLAQFGVGASRPHSAGGEVRRAPPGQAGKLPPPAHTAGGAPAPAAADGAPAWFADNVFATHEGDAAMRQHARTRDFAWRQRRKLQRNESVSVSVSGAVPHALWSEDVLGQAAPVLKRSASQACATVSRLQLSVGSCATHMLFYPLFLLNNSMCPKLKFKSLNSLKKLYLFQTTL